MSYDPLPEIPTTLETLWPKRPVRPEQVSPSFVRLQASQQAAKALANKLCEWLEATTSYSNEPKDNLNTYPNHEAKPAWRRFYQFGPILEMGGLLDADGKPTELKLAVKHISYDQSVQPGSIITSASGRKYIVQINGSLRKCN